MNRPVNMYYPGEPLPAPLHGIGRPVTLFVGQTVKAGTVTSVMQNRDGELRYDVQVIDGGAHRNVQLGSLNNPQPNTFVFAP